MRRVIYLLLFFLLCSCCFYWQSLAALGLRALLYTQFSRSLAVGEVRWKKGAVLLENVSLQRESVHVHCPEVRLYWAWPFQIDLLIEHPHLEILALPAWAELSAASSLDPRSWMKSNRWLQKTTRVSVKEGTFSWREQKGRFALRDHFLTVSLEEEGKREEQVQIEWISSVHEQKIHCTLAHWPLDLLRAALPPAWELSGQVSGTLHAVLRGDQGDQLSLALTCEDLRLASSAWDVQGYAKKLEFQGEGSSWTAFDRLRVRFQDGEMTRAQGHLDQLRGSFSWNQALGARLECVGPSLRLEGRLFSNSRLANWLDGSLSFGESRVHLHRSAGEGDELFYDMELFHLQRPLIELLCSYAPRLIPLQWHGGVVEGRLSWKGRQGHALGDGASLNALLSIQNAALQYQQLSCSQLYSTIRIEAGEIGQGLLEGECNGWRLRADLGGQLTGGSLEVDLQGPERIALKGGFAVEEDGVMLTLGPSSFGSIGWEGYGYCAFQSELPFFFQAQEVKGPVQPLCAFLEQPAFTQSLSGHLTGSVHCSGHLLPRIPTAWQWKAALSLQEMEWGSFSEGSAVLVWNSEEELLSLTHLTALWKIGAFTFPLRAVEMRKQERSFSFDVRLGDSFWELARFKGTACSEGEGFALSLHPTKSHLLSSSLEVDRCHLSSLGTIDRLNVKAYIDWPTLIAARGSLMNRPSSPLLAEFAHWPIDGGLVVNVELDEKATLLSVRGAGLCYDQQLFPFLLEARKEMGRDLLWKIDSCQLGSYWAQGALHSEADRWKVDVLSVGCEGMRASLHGYLDPCKCALNLGELSLSLEKAPLLSSLSCKGTLNGTGCLSMHWEEGFHYDLDLDLQPATLELKELFLHPIDPLQLHLSDRGGISVRGLNIEMSDSLLSRPWLFGKVGLFQLDLAQKRLLLNHSQLFVPSDGWGVLKEKKEQWGALLTSIPSPEQDLSCMADFTLALDGSFFSCSMKEGQIPCFGAIQRLQDVQIEYNRGATTLVSLQATHQGHPFQLQSRFHLDPHPMGTLVVKDEEHPFAEGEHPLTIQWELPPGRGWRIHSIEGMVGGMDLSFYEEAYYPDRANLAGSAKIHFGVLSELLPPRFAKVFHRLKMGKGYELKGKLSYNADDFSFAGWLSGKGCELFGYQVRTLLAHLEATSHKVHLSAVKGSDSAGLLKIEELLVEREDVLSPWRLSSPSIKLEELRPSFLQKVGKEVGLIGPLIIRNLTLNNLQGELDDSFTYTAQGEMSFINSFKRDYTLLDLPSEVLSRIIGLDLELLIPVQGKMRLELKEGRVWLDDLQDAYSEGKRSKFFLVHEGLSPSVDLEGNVAILVKMKQYVLFKITENFLLSIGGTLDEPSTHLQKKSKGFGG